MIFLGPGTRQLTIDETFEGHLLVVLLANMEQQRVRFEVAFVTVDTDPGAACHYPPRASFRTFLSHLSLFCDYLVG